MQQTIDIRERADAPLVSIPLESLPKIVRIGTQIAGLWAISYGSTWIAQEFHLPIPGNVLGLCILFGALLTGSIKLSWLDSGGGMLTKHLAFFFVPITVGLMGFGPTFAHAGFALAVTLVLSAAVGLLAAAFTTQLLATRRRS